MAENIEDRIITIMRRFGYTGSDVNCIAAQNNPATGYELALEAVCQALSYIRRVEAVGTNGTGQCPASLLDTSPCLQSA